ncbi:hypothetical protein DFP73DRAFT_560541 [Morchella snyderi]|nr:hypothetical protein DFP73DRAFT_560541 [Morchella snyderi]
MATPIQTVPDHHWTISTSTGRRVSLLCDEEIKSVYEYASSSTSSPTPPLSPAFGRPYATRHDSIESNASTTSLVSLSLYSPRTPPNLGLPPLNKFMSGESGAMFPGSSPINSSPNLVTSILSHQILEPEQLSPRTLTRTPVSSVPPSPKSGAPNPVVKRSARRYTCQCGKSFTTSGHLARHTRIHTGEKNYVCPEDGCGARFSRQDNCMQHYRTHQSGSATKRAARKRRMSAEDVVLQEQRAETAAVRPELHPRMHTYHSQTHPVSYTHYSDSFGGESGLNALASVASATSSGYP